MTKNSNLPKRSRSTRYRQRQLAKERRSLWGRIRGLQGRARILVFGGALVIALAIIAGSGGTAYALNLENNDAFCASCHTQPETKYYQQSLDKTPATLAAFHTTKNTRCIDCHSGGGAFGRVQGLTQGTQDLVSYYSGHYNNPAIVTNKLGDDSCLKCHGDIPGRTDFNNHFHRFLAQWQSVDPNAARCIDCHTAHPTTDSTLQYLDRGTVQQQCQACHNNLRQ